MLFRNLFRRIAIRTRAWEVVFSLPAIVHVTLKTVKLCFSLTEVCYFCLLWNEPLFSIIGVYFVLKKYWYFITHKTRAFWAFWVCYLFHCAFFFSSWNHREISLLKRIKTNYYVHYCYIFSSDIRNFEFVTVLSVHIHHIYETLLST